jgi:hypothetical protein
MTLHQEMPEETFFEALKYYCCRWSQSNLLLISGNHVMLVSFCDLFSIIVVDGVSSNLVIIVLDGVI